MEEKIWNLIIDSAKKKFDFLSFEKDFPFDTDGVIFKIITGFAAEQKKEILVLELHNQMLPIGFNWDRKDIAKFIEGKESLFKIEIYACQLAIDMLNNGNDTISVFNSISQLLR